MDFTKFAAMLDSGALFFPSIDTLCKIDPYEGSYSDSWRVLLGMPFSLLPTAIAKAIGVADKDAWDSYVKHNRAAAATIKKDQQRVYASSWHRQDHESLAMWTQYASRGEGIAIVSSTARLIRALADVEDEVFISKVRYVDYDRTLMGLTGDWLNPCVHKRLGFEHEKEVRAIIWHETGAPRAAGGLAVKLPLDTLIGTVIVAPSAPQWVVNLVEALVKKYEYNMPVYQSRLLTAPTDADFAYLEDVMNAVRAAAKANTKGTL